jgi:signal peptidase I
MRAAAIERRVRKEARALVGEVRRGLRAGRGRLGEAIRGELERRATALDAARLAGDGGKMRAELYPLDEMADEHLGFARKSTAREYAESIGVAVLIALMLRAFVIEAFKIPSGSMIPTMEIGDHIFVNKFIYGIRIPYTRLKFFEWRRPTRGEVIVFINPCEPDKDFIKRIVAVGGDTVEVRCDVLYVNGVAVPATLVDEPCSYWDNDTGGTGAEWGEETCSLYLERHGGTEYQTIYGDRRPELDRMRTGSLDQSYARLRSAADFPDHAPPDCPLGDDPRTDEQRRTSRGSLEESRPESGEVVGSCAPQKRYRVPKDHVFVMGDNRANSSDSRRWGAVPLENIKGKALFIWWSSQRGEPQLGRIGRIVQ